MNQRKFNDMKFEKIFKIFDQSTFRIFLKYLISFINIFIDKSKY